MPSAPFVLPAIILAGVLILSGIAKLRAPRESADAFVALRLPPALARLGAPRLLPYAELVLAAALLLAPGSAYLPAAVLALALFLAYLAIIARAVRFPEPVTCACFGRLGLGTVSGVTVVRNAVLVAVAVLALVDAAVHDHGVGQRLAEFTGAQWTWVALAGLAALVAGLIVHRPGTKTGSAGREALDGDELEYLRQPIPYGLVERPDKSSVALRALAADRARLLVFLSLGCGPCLRVIEFLPDFVAANPEVGVHAVLHSATAVESIPEWMDYLLDPDGTLAATFAVPTPAAVLLGADGLLAGGPVIGEPAVREFLDDIAAELSGAREATPELLSGR
ncbi:MAG: MauE/DoxX family redox-associated membrane protein [Tetrasphaera sp.]